MTTHTDTTAQPLDRMNANIGKIEDLSQRLVNALAHKRSYDQGLAGPGQDVFVKALGAYWSDMLNNPAKVFEHQVSFWGKTVQHFMEAQQAMSQGQFAAPDDHTPTDTRFKNPLWQSHPYFNFVKQQYFLNAQAVEKAVSGLDGLTPQDQKRIEYFSKQIVDLFAPTNFLATNPDALERAVETEGDSLVAGLENLVNDIETNGGEVLVSLADNSAFTVGENIATSPGQVVFRNRMMELIQYAPATEQVHRLPLVIFPPWINKFYILDLKPKNSLIKWAVEQGYTVYVVSWRNPDETYADVSIETYIEEGYLEAIRVAKEICDVPQVNTVGYCIGGTTLAMTLALLNKRKDKSVKSATFFTTITDFSDQGEFVPFLSDDFVDGIEREVAQTGFLDSFFMSRTFSYLRSNDLIYTPAIKSYMMGEAPPAFDLLYWNGDSTNLPGAMVVQYLRELCQRNSFAGDGITLCGETLSIRDVKVPLCTIACETDHIAKWMSSYQGIQQMGASNKTFILSESGHIAGIINPPSKKKYGHYMNPDMSVEAPEWLEAAHFTEGSWWPTWHAWLAPQSGKMLQAREPGAGDFPALCAAPGTYVQRSDAAKPEGDAD